MATHTGGNQNYGRKFQISRKDGQSDKNGEPFFFEWLRDTPQNPENRRFEQRGQYTYELFKALDGYLTGFERRKKTIQDAHRDFLYVELVDGDEKYVIEVGDYDGRFSIDLMKRVLNPNFDASAKIRLSPYAFTDSETGKPKIGVSVYCGVDKITASLNDVPVLSECPEATTTTFKGQTMWDFSTVAEWLFQQVIEKIEKGTRGNFTQSAPPAQAQPAQTNVTASPAANEVHLPHSFSGPAVSQRPDAPMTDVDDLPF
jgi:hypothetical protein